MSYRTVLVFIHGFIILDLAMQEARLPENGGGKCAQVI